MADKLAYQTVCCFTQSRKPEMPWILIWVIRVHYSTRRSEWVGPWWQFRYHTIPCSFIAQVWQTANLH